MISAQTYLNNFPPNPTTAVLSPYLKRLTIQEYRQYMKTKTI